MDCGNCSHDNESNAKFCSECGAPQELACGSCDAVQPAGAKFCNQCGTSFASSTTPSKDTPATGSSAVRKTVTALFGDLVGSTSFGEQVDPEATRAVMADYFELLRSTIEDHAGTVAKFMGDGVMAVFGIPEIAEDDALRAVAAAAELQQRFRSFADSVRERHGVELGLRVGVNTGELVIGDDDADMVGDVLNTAARLEAACQPGRVLVGEDTWRLTRSLITYEVLGEIRVKGKADPIATFQVVADTDQATDEVTPFVGRQDELAELQAVFSEARDSGAARLVTVIGAPGVGKTRLAAELRAAHDVRSFDLRFERRGSTTFTPVADLLRELTGTGSADDVARLVAGHTEAGRLTDVLAALLGHGETRSTEESFWAVRRLLEMLAIDGPLIMVVDDIQWAEPLFWDLLDHLVEWTDAPVFLLALARPELRELKPELAQIGKRVSAAIALEGLDAATTRELAAQLLDTDELPSDLIERIPDSTDGNPLFVREMVQMLVDDGVLERTGDRWRLTIDVEAIEVPPTILSLLASRVERLPDDERQVVELASVIGTEFDHGSLTALEGGEIGSRLGPLIDRLRRKDLIEPSGAWAGDHPVYRFHHVLIRDAAYRRLLKARRADLHERVGRHLETAEATDELDVMIAHHYEQVHAYRSALGTLDDVTMALADQAARRLQSAALLALSREDLSASGGYVLRALALTPDGEVRDELLTLGCEALLSSGDVARGAPVVEELSERSSDPRLDAWADCFRAQLWSLTDSERLIEASQLADGAADRLTSLGDDAGVAKARLVRALILARLGRVGDCEAELDLALGAARAAGDRRRTVAVLGAAPLAALWGPSPVARAGGRCLDVLRLLRITTASPAVEATSIRCQGMLEALRGRFDSAREKFETSRTTARDLGLRHGLYETELFEGFAELLAGDPVAAEPHLVLARDGLGALGIGADAGQASALLARALLRQGRIDEADVLASAALEAAGENLQTAVASRSVLGEIRVEQGRPDEARQLIAAALEIVEQTDITIDHAITQRSAARVADRLGNANDAQSHRAAAERLLADKGVTGLAETRSERAVAVPSEQGTPADDGETQRVALVPPNSAWNVNEGLWSTWIAGDRSGYLQLLASDFRARIHELGPKLAFSGDRNATADVLFESLADDRVHAIPNRLIAVRGDDLALIAMTFRDGTSSTTMYTVSQVSDGRALRADTFAEDQLGDALDELDRRWVTLGAPADAVELLIELRRSTADGDYTGLRGLLADDFEMVSHEGLTLIDRRSADDFVESTRPLYGEGGLATPILTDVPAITDGLALTRHHLDAPDGSGWRLWYLWVWEFGRFTRAEIYELDDFENALARFEELRSVPPAAPPRFSNAAFEWVLGFNAALNANESDRMRAMLHPEFEMLAESEFFTGGLGAGQAVDWYLTGLATGQTVDEELIAIRGNDHCLVRLFGRSDGYENEYLGVVSIGEGQAIRHRWLDPETQLTEAQQDLDRMWLDSLGFAADHPMRRLAVAAFSVDPSELLSITDPDIDYREHRRMSFVGGTHAELAANFESMALGDHVIIPVAHRVSDNASVIQRDEVGSAGETSSSILVTSLHDGLGITYDVYDLEDLDAAIARFDELERFEELAAKDAAGPDSTNEGRVERLFAPNFSSVNPERLSTGAEPLDRDGLLANTASRLGDELAAAYGAADVKRLRQIVAADFSWQSRTHFASALDAPDRDRDSYLEGVFGRLDEQTAPWVGDRQLLAVRGDELYLARSVIQHGDDEIERLAVGRSANGQLVQLIQYDPDQLTEAHLELDQQWVSLGGPARIIEANRRYREIFAGVSKDRLEDLITDDFESVDHRPLGLGVRSADEYSTSIAEFVGRADVVVAAYDTFDGLNCLSRGSFSVRDNGAVLVDGWVLTSCSEDLRFRRLELFETDQLTAARARFDELVEQTPSGPPAFSNRAWEMQQRCQPLYGKPEFAQFLAPSFESRIHEPFRTDDEPRSRQEFVDLMVEFASWSDDGWSSVELIANRGDELCLVRNTLRNGPDERINLVVVQWTDDLAQSADWYGENQLDEAQIELDRLYFDSLGLAKDHVLRRLGPYAYTTDPTDAAAIAHPDLEYGEHRALSFEDGGHDELIVALSSYDLIDHVVVPVFHRLGDHVVLFQKDEFDRHDNVSSFLLLASYLDGLCGTIDVYDLADLGAALARYDELVEETPTDPTPTLTNTATVVAKQFELALKARDLDLLRGMFHPDYKRTMRETFRTQDTWGIDGEIDFLRGLADVKAVIDLEPIAIRGDDLSAFSAVIGSGHTNVDAHAVTVVRDGLILELITFDDAQLEETLDELDRQWVELGRSSENP